MRNTNPLKSKNRALLMVLLGLVSVFYGITLVRMGGGNPSTLSRTL